MRGLFASYGELALLDPGGNLVLFRIAEYVAQRKAGQLVDHQGNLIHGAAYVHPTAQVRNSIIGSGASVHEFTTVRDSLIDANSVIGHCSEVARSIIGARASVPRFNYVGGSILGSEVRLGGCVSIASRRFDQGHISIRYGSERYFTDQPKMGALIGDETMVGFGSHVNPGVIIGRRCLIGPYCDVRRDIPDDYVIVVDQKLAARPRQREDFHARR